MFIRKYAFLAAAFSVAVSSGHGAAPATVQVVSAASFQPLVSPDSLGTVFGGGLAAGITVAERTSTGSLPQTLAGVSVQIGNQPMGMIYVSPNQINFWIPPDVPVGVSTLAVVRDG